MTRPLDPRLLESEERYQRLVEVFPDLVAVHQDEQFVYINPAGASLLGFATPEHVLGCSIYDVVPPDQHELVRKRVKGALETTAGIRPELQPLLRQDGATVEVEMMGLRIAHGGRPAVMVVARDVTRRRELERMQDEFLSTVSHELRTPLSTVCGALDVLVGGGLAPSQQERMLAIAASNARRLVRLVNDLLDAQALARGKLRVISRPTEVEPLVHQSAELCQAAAEAAGVQLVVRSVPVSIVLDGDRLVQVLTNLLTNAIKFSPPGSRVELEQLLVPEGLLCRVLDRGRGIPADALETVFERFVQVDPEDAWLRGGTGLGLAICKAIVVQHGGRIWAERRPGGGSTFTFVLPSTTEADADWVG